MQSIKLIQSEITLLLLYKPGVCIVSRNLGSASTSTLFLSKTHSGDCTGLPDSSFIKIHRNLESLFLSFIKKEYTSKIKKLNIIFDNLNYATQSIPLQLTRACQLKEGNPFNQQSKILITSLSKIFETFPLNKSRPEICFDIISPQNTKINIIIKNMLDRQQLIYTHLNNEIIPVVLELMRLSNCNQMDVLGGKRQAVFHSFVESNPILKKKLIEQKSAASNSSSSIKLKGGLILRASTGFHKFNDDECATLLDFASVYPRIGSTVLKDHCIELANTFAHLVEYRTELTNKGNFSGAKAVKLLANTIYGCLASRNSKYSNLFYASLITKNCRESLAHMVNVINDLPQCIEVLYGHTDSVIVLHKKDDLEEIVSVVEEEVCKKLSLKIKIDGSFNAAILIVDSVAYAGFNKKEDGTLSITTKGLEGGASTPKLVANIFRHQCLEHVFYSKHMNAYTLRYIFANCRQALRTTLSQIFSSENPPSLSQLTFFSRDQKYKNVVGTDGAHIISVENNQVSLPHHLLDLPRKITLNSPFYETKKLNTLLNKIEGCIINNNINNRKRTWSDDEDDEKNTRKSRALKLKRKTDDYLKKLCSDGVEPLKENK